MSEPVVAIVVRTKDRPSLLRRALASIVAQEFALWECIVVNDGGDPTAVDEVLAEVSAPARERIRAVHVTTSRGRWKSANAGVLGTTAPLLVLHDDDDSWHPRFLAEAVSYLAQNPNRDGVVSRIEIVWEKPTGSTYEVTGREIFQPQLHDLLLSDALLFNRYVPIGFVYRRSLHEELGLYDESLPVIGDWAFNLKVLQRGPLEFLGDTPLVYWHQRVDDAGPGGNSVIDARNDHERYDALLRDAALREFTSANGLGLALYMTKFIDRRLVDVENGIRDEISRSSLTGRIVRRFRHRRGRTNR